MGSHLGPADHGLTKISRFPLLRGNSRGSLWPSTPRSCSGEHEQPKDHEHVFYCCSRTRDMEFIPLRRAAYLAPAQGRSTWSARCKRREASTGRSPPAQVARRPFPASRSGVGRSTSRRGGGRNCDVDIKAVLRTTRQLCDTSESLRRELDAVTDAIALSIRDARRLVAKAKARHSVTARCPPGPPNSSFGSRPGRSRGVDESGRGRDGGDGRRDRRD